MDKLVVSHSVIERAVVVSEEEVECCFISGLEDVRKLALLEPEEVEYSIEPAYDVAEALMPFNSSQVLQLVHPEREGNDRDNGTLRILPLECLGETTDPRIELPDAESIQATFAKIYRELLDWHQEKLN